MGPGLVTGASDDDPSGIATYSQVGSQFGYGLLWTAFFTLPLMLSVQELCARIAIETRKGLGVVLTRKFPAWLVAAGVLGLLAANTLNMGADLGAVVAGIHLLIGNVIPGWGLAVFLAAAIVAIQFLSTYEGIAKVFKVLTLALFAYVFTAFVAHGSLAEVVKATFIPRIQFSAGFITAMVAILGTTISPYLFFWQATSEAVSLPRSGKLRGDAVFKARIDVGVGMAFSQIVMYCIILCSAAELNAHGITTVATAQQAANALAPFAGHFATVLFAVGLIGTGMLAIPILSQSAAYAVKELTGIRGGLTKPVKEAPKFYAILVVPAVIAVVMNLVNFNPISALFITAVVNGIFAPPILLLIILAGSDAKIMKGKTSGKLSRTLTWATCGAMFLALCALILLNVGPLKSK